MTFSQYFNNILKFIALVAIAIALDRPEKIGEWKAQMDIGYDSVWSEYVSDCDCAEALE